MYPHTTLEFTSANLHFHLEFAFLETRIFFYLALFLVAPKFSPDSVQLHPPVPSSFTPLLLQTSLTLHFMIILPDAYSSV